MTEYSITVKLVCIPAPSVRMRELHSQFHSRGRSHGSVLSGAVSNGDDRLRLGGRRADGPRSVGAHSRNPPQSSPARALGPSTVALLMDGRLAVWRKALRPRLECSDASILYSPLDVRDCYDRSWAHGISFRQWHRGSGRFSDVRGRTLRAVWPNVVWRVRWRDGDCAICGLGGIVLVAALWSPLTLVFNLALVTNGILFLGIGIGHARQVQRLNPTR